MANGIRQNLGPVSAYALARKHGYTGSEEEFSRGLYETGTYAQEAKTAAAGASEDRSRAETAASNAQRSETAASGFASNASGSAERAETAKTGAETAVYDASRYAMTAYQSETNASRFATKAETAQKAAEAAQGKAETAQGKAEQASNKIVTLGLKNMKVGDKVVVKAVGPNGEPTEWAPEGGWELIDDYTLEKPMVINMERLNLKAVRILLVSPGGIAVPILIVRDYYGKYIMQGGLPKDYNIMMIEAKWEGPILNATFCRAIYEGASEIKGPVLQYLKPGARTPPISRITSNEELPAGVRIVVEGIKYAD